MGWTQGNLIFKEIENRRERKCFFFTIKLKVKKWRGRKKMETGDFSALARGESKSGGNDEVAQDGNEDKSGNGYLW